MNIPIFLYVKEHSITKKKYFGKTTKDPFKYKGSGIHWINHIKIHGNDVITTIIGKFDSIDECEKYALNFSEMNNIVESKNWLNLKYENGLDGAVPGTKLSEETKKKISNALKGKTYPKTKYDIKDIIYISNLRRETQKGRIWINDGIKDKKVFPDFIPDGWIKGRLNNNLKNKKNIKQTEKIKIQNLGRHWWTDGNSNKFQKQSPGINWKRGIKKNDSKTTV